MSNPFVAEIRIFPFNFAPRGWAFCDGQLLPLSQNTALFSLLGTTYGGDGKSNFALPNLQGNAPMQQGQGPGLSDRFLGEQSGSETVTLLQSEIPAHPHSLNATTVKGTTASPSGAELASGQWNNNQGGSGGLQYYTTTAPSANMSPFAIGVAGGSLPHNNMMPYLTLNFCIALQGVFPPRP
jgi:microcystin-dependent protein